jgi:hypothetical protein
MSTLARKTVSCAAKVAAAAQAARNGTNFGMNAIDLP